MLCPVWVAKNIRVKEHIWIPDPKFAGVLNPNNQSVPKISAGTQTVLQKKFVICGRKTQTLIQVKYSSFPLHRQGESKYEDLFHMCHEHGKEFTYLRNWMKGEMSVSGQRGTVGSIQVIHGSNLEALAKEDKNQRKIAGVKARVKQMMSQRNTRDLTVDHWRKAFEDVLEEWVVEQVMES